MNRKFVNLTALILVLLVTFQLDLKAQDGRPLNLNTTANFEKYKEDNNRLKFAGNKDLRVVFIGNSITEGWVNTNPTFFTDNNYIGRGIGGQTSPQLLLRFRRDVLDLQPKVVVIGIGTNDIAENSGKYDLEFTLSNIESMAEIATANGIKVIITSVLPTSGYSWKKSVENVVEKIDELNTQLELMADTKGYIYVDYNTDLRDEQGAMQAAITSDGVHVLIEGYKMMEAIVKPVIDDLLAAE